MEEKKTEKIQTLTDARKFIPSWFKSKKVHRKKDLYFFKFETAWLDYLDDIRAFRTTASPKKKKGFRPVAERDMTKAFSEHISILCDEFRLKTAHSLACETETLVPLTKFVTALTGKADEKDIAVLAHFFWSVKRKMQDQKVVYHIMPIFLGKQGSGKSMAVSKMLTPFGDFVLNMFVNDLADKNSYPEFSNNAVVLFDELAGLNKTDRNVLKNQLTTEYNTYRPFYTQQKITAPQRCSFIGTSNQSLAELFYDPTGMRRFYEIQTLDRCDWQTINAIDYSELVKGIDEKRERGYLEEGVLTKIAKAQDTYVNHDDSEMYCNELHLLPTGEDFAKIRDVNLYDDYSQWSKRRGHRYQHNMQQFNRKMQALGLVCEMERPSTGGRHRMFKINSKADILGVNKGILRLQRSENE